VIDVTEGLLAQTITQHLGRHLFCGLIIAALNTNSSAKPCNVNHDVAYDCHIWQYTQRHHAKIVQRLTCTVESAEVEAARRQVLMLSA